MERAAGEEEFAQATAYFGVSPVSIVNDVFNAVDDYLADGVDALEGVLLEKLSVDERAIREGADNLLDKLRACFDRNIDKFEMYVLRNIFYIPEGVLPAALPPSEQDRPIAVATDDSMGEIADPDAVSAELVQLRERLHAARHVRARLTAERSHYEAHLTAMEVEAERLHQATSVFHRLQITDPRSALSTVRQQTQVLRELTNRMQEMRREMSSKVPQSDSTASASQRSAGSRAAVGSAGMLTEAPLAVMSPGRAQQLRQALQPK